MTWTTDALIDISAVVSVAVQSVALHAITLKRCYSVPTHLLAASIVICTLVVVYASDSSIIGMLTGVNTYWWHSTVQELCVLFSAVVPFQEDGSFSFPKECSAIGNRPIVSVSCLLAYHVGLIFTESGVTNCAPGIVNADFYPSLEKSRAIDQSDVSIGAVPKVCGGLLADHSCSSLLRLARWRCPCGLTLQEFCLTSSACNIGYSNIK
jgi:hypothetical protein